MRVVDSPVPFLHDRPALRRYVERTSEAEEARLRWLVHKVRDMKLTRSRLLAEARERTGTGKDVSWSQMIFTDLFGPDVSILGEIRERISRLERNIERLGREARLLHRRLRR